MYMNINLTVIFLYGCYLKARFQSCQEIKLTLHTYVSLYFVFTNGKLVVCNITIFTSGHPHKHI